MNDPLTRSREREPLHRGLIGAGSTLLMSAFVTDCAYRSTGLWQWANFSAWLITAGLIVVLFAAIFLLIDFATGRASRLSIGPVTLVGAAAVLSLINAFVHSRDAWTSVVPEGIVLSALVTILLLAVGLRGWSVVKSPTLGDHQ